MKLLGGILLILGLILVFGMDIYSKKRTISTEKKLLIKTSGLICVMAAFWIIIKMI